MFCFSSWYIYMYIYPGSISRCYVYLIPWYIWSPAVLEDPRNLKPYCGDLLVHILTECCIEYFGFCRYVISFYVLGSAYKAVLFWLLKVAYAHCKMAVPFDLVIVALLVYSTAFYGCPLQWNSSSITVSVTFVSCNTITSSLHFTSCVRRNHVLDRVSITLTDIILGEYCMFLVCCVCFIFLFQVSVHYLHWKAGDVVLCGRKTLGFIYFGDHCLYESGFVAQLL